MVMRLHLRRPPRANDAALKIIKADTTRRLQNEIAETRMDSRMPRHFKDREHFRLKGEIA